MRKILKGILLYSSIIYVALFLMGAESLAQLSVFYFIIGLCIFIILIAFCGAVFKNDDLKNYIPKWLH
jgi:uncharacterized membrane protein YcaP (DUF421 family)